MNRVKTNAAVAAVVGFLWIVFVAADSALAHRVNVFAWVDGDTVHVESKFFSGNKVKAGEIIVEDQQGTELLRGITDDQGEFSFKVPKKTDLRIVLIAGQGHQAVWTIRAAEMEELQLESTSETSAGEAMQAEPIKAVPETSSDTLTAVPNNVTKPKELETIIEAVLDRKLRPITRMLADIQQKGTTARDFFAGIGYILGLVGIVAYVHARKKKE